MRNARRPSTVSEGVGKLGELPTQTTPNESMVVAFLQASFFVGGGHVSTIGTELMRG